MRPVQKSCSPFSTALSPGRLFTPLVPRSQSPPARPPALPAPISWLATPRWRPCSASRWSGPRPPTVRSSLPLTRSHPPRPLFNATMHPFRIPVSQDPALTNARASSSPSRPLLPVYRETECRRLQSRYPLMGLGRQRSLRAGISPCRASMTSAGLHSLRARSAAQYTATAEQFVLLFLYMRCQVSNACFERMAASMNELK